MPEPPLLDLFATLDRCESYVVLMVDPETGEADAHGPFDGLAANLAADRLRGELDANGLSDVPHRGHPPAPIRPGRHRALRLLVGSPGRPFRRA